MKMLVEEYIGVLVALLLGLALVFVGFSLFDNIDEQMADITSELSAESEELDGTEDVVQAEVTTEQTDVSVDDIVQNDTVATETTVIEETHIDISDEQIHEIEFIGVAIAIAIIGVLIKFRNTKKSSDLDMENLNKTA